MLNLEFMELAMRAKAAHDSWVNLEKLMENFMNKNFAEIELGSPKGLFKFKDGTSYQNEEIEEWIVSTWS